MAESIKTNTLVLDAGPIIMEPADRLQQLAESFYTTPGVYNELKDETVRAKLPLWSDKLQVRQPKPASIKAVSDFARLTGDYAVLSMNDVHLIALVYELECEQNGGPDHLRQYPGEGETKKQAVVTEEKQDNDDGWTTVGRKQEAPRRRKRGGRKHKKKSAQKETVQVASEEATKSTPEATLEEEKAIEEIDNSVQNLTIDEEKSEVAEKAVEQAAMEVNEVVKEQEEELDDEDGWIGPDNLAEEMLKDKNEGVNTDDSVVKVALSTGDFAVQNVTLQMGMNLLDTMSGRRIKRVKNYMYRCHACFQMTPMPKDGTPKHFCPNCGGATLMRCAVTVTSKGNVIPHLKKNFEWHTKGNVYSLPQPLSKKTSKRYGRQGYQHRGNPNIEEVYLSEDQREYQKAVKEAKWQRRQAEKAMEDFVGGGSADNIVSPFLATTANIRPVKVAIGKGRDANAPRRKRK